MKIRFYKIIAPDGREYIGSTKNTIAVRKGIQKYHYNNGYRNCASAVLYDAFGFDACRWELIEEGEYATRKDGYMREGDLIRASATCINKKNAYSSPELRKEQLRIYDEKTKKAYYQANRDTILEKAKIRYEAKKKIKAIL